MGFDLDFLRLIGYVVVDGVQVYGGDCGGWAYGNRFLHSKPNTKNNFLVHFPRHRQTIENIFLYAENILHEKYFT